MNIKEMAQIINSHIDQNENFWAYGLIQETYKLWIINNNENLLCETAQFMLEMAEDDPKAVK